MPLIFILIAVALLLARKRRGGYRGFKSKAQWRWAWATHKPWARKKSHQTAGGPKVRFRRLPLRKGIRKRPR